MILLREERPGSISAPHIINFERALRLPSLVGGMKLPVYFSPSPIRLAPGDVTTSSCAFHREASTAFATLVLNYSEPCRGMLRRPAPYIETPSGLSLLVSRFMPRRVRSGVLKAFGLE